MPNIVNAIGITLLVGLIALYEWPKINPEQKKEKKAFVVLSVIGWGLALLLVYFPNIAGPNDLIDFIYQPITKMME
ncbi:hypothetical protein [Texcoconibacillus texcoconensis]|uniref:CDP-diglyceride synthetase n=1 Tax=Texcoconibacillus texcoconensis TaxID=1095777 RepID=A0A840QLP1_9BACI|nr:hypothetical protein [Texcoconibacillus texcoconensis]MBB5172289.1 CDP-diglyceride synthetase [Texcoconibacillus texcoconensis]